MKKPVKKRSAVGVPSGRHEGNNNQKSGCCLPPRSGAPDLQKDEKLIEQIRQIIAETPEVRLEKVGPLGEAVASGTYEIDARKLANCLITKIILDA
jgi:anti-sigma28 factor (negative regulator of flagellin synthesis)